MSDNLIDARGLSCPEPVLMAKQALKDYPNGGFAMAVSSATARDNVLALLESNGFAPVLEDKQEEWFIQAPAK